MSKVAKPTDTAAAPTASRARDFLMWRRAPDQRSAPAPRRGKPVEGLSGEAKAKGQFFTAPDFAKHCLDVLRRYVDIDGYQVVEPSAGQGAFLHILPEGTFGCDIERMSTDVFAADFLTLEIESNRPLLFVGNPPFGRNAGLAKRFFKHAASQGDVIAFILPRTFRKVGTVNALDDRFHMIHEEPVPPKAFVFQGKPYSVTTVFQIWARCEHRRAPLPELKTHPDFKFTSSEEGDFGLQRVGKDAGRVHREMDRSHRAHYFIKGDVEGTMRRCRSAFAAAASNTAGKPSLSMGEVVAIYEEQIARDRSHASRPKPEACGGHARPAPECGGTSCPSSGSTRRCATGEGK